MIICICLTDLTREDHARHSQLVSLYQLRWCDVIHGRDTGHSLPVRHNMILWSHRLSLSVVSINYFLITSSSIIRITVIPKTAYSSDTDSQIFTINNKCNGNKFTDFTFYGLIIYKLHHLFETFLTNGLPKK